MIVSREVLVAEALESGLDYWDVAGTPTRELRPLIDGWNTFRTLALVEDVEADPVGGEVIAFPRRHAARLVVFPGGVA